MSLTIDFSPQEEARLAAAAQAEGTDRATVLRNLVHTYLPQPKVAVDAEPDAENQRFIDLLRSWSVEDATDDEDELERRDVESSEFLRNLKANRLTLRLPEV